MSEQATASNNIREDIGDGSDALDRFCENAFPLACCVAATLLALAAIGAACVALVKLAPLAL